ncbi:MAG: dTDP-4-dehydrorhamnose reductase [Rikenellaceae bacterium]
MSKFDPINILVTGANGQLGRRVRAAAERSTDNYIYTDVAELDITDRAAVEGFVAQNRIDLIINCAAYTNVDQAESDEAMAEKINCAACEVLSSAAKGAGATLIHISTDYVFDGEGDRPYKESDPTSPLGVYGVTKRRGEEAIERSGCNYQILRTAWLYSEECRNFMLTILRVSREREELRVVADQIGTPTYAGDLAETIVSIVASRKYVGEREIYHYSGEGECSWHDFAFAIVECDGGAERCRVNPCSSDEYPTPVKRPKYSVLDKSKIQERMGVEIPNWREALQRAYNNIK